jgi:hypothetical protein
LRAVVDGALARSAKGAGKRSASAETPRAQAAAAGAGSKASANDAPEFEILTEAPDPDGQS